MLRAFRKILLIVLVLVVLGTLAYRSRGAINLKGFSWSDLLASVQQANPWRLLLSLATIFVVYAIRALRWARFSRSIGRPTFGNVYRATLIGFSAIFLLGRAGEPVRPLLIARMDHLPVSSTFGIYVLERIFDLAATVVIAGLSLLLIPQEVMQAGSASLVARARAAGTVMLLGLAGATAFLVYFRLHGAGALGRRLEAWRAGPAKRDWRHRIAGLFAGFSEGLQAIRTFGDLVLAISYSVVHWVLVIIIYVWVASSFGGRLGELGFVAAMVVLAFTMVGSVVQLPAVGGGSQAASFIAFTQLFGVEPEPAAACSIVLWLKIGRVSCRERVYVLV